MISSCDLVEVYLKGRAILLKPPSLRCQQEKEFIKQWLLERVSLLSALKLNEGALVMLLHIAIYCKSRLSHLHG